MHRLTAQQRSILTNATKVVYEALLVDSSAARILAGQDYRRLRWIGNLIPRMTKASGDTVYDYSVTGIMGKREVVTFHMEITVEERGSHIADQIFFRLYVESDQGVTGTIHTAFQGSSVVYDAA